MQIILLERIAKLGQMGDVVTVKDGYARNFLLPGGKALRANKANLARFEQERVQLEAHNLAQKTEAEAVKAKLDGQSFVTIRQSGETGQLYGSVNTRDIANVLTEKGFSITRRQVALDNPIKTLGLFTTAIILHPEVTANVTINVARTEDEAIRQARGEDVTAEKTDTDAKEKEQAQEQAQAQAETMFEENVQVKQLDDMIDDSTEPAQEAKAQGDMEEKTEAHTDGEAKEKTEEATQAEAEKS